MNTQPLRVFLTLICLVFLCENATFSQAEELPKLSEIRVTSQLDQTEQPSKIWVPEIAKTEPVPVLIFLHSWSGNYHQKNVKWYREAIKRNWLYLHPNFRGRNSSPKACGSKYARQDILDALDYVLANYSVDESRIYLAGSSGGGHMTMLMAGHHPERFSAASAWVGISDLTKWYQFHLKDGVPQNYAQMILASLERAPGSSSEIDAQYKDRSPLFHLHRVGNLPVELNAGVHDGHTGSVPISHTLEAFNVIAKSQNAQLISQKEIDQLWKHQKLESPTPEDTATDPTYKRAIHLRRKTKTARVTIFEGGHESLPLAACEWLSKQQRKTKISPSSK